jgi:hypothetical protein
MVQFGFQGVQTSFDIAETVAAGQLSKRHAEKLIEAGELPDTIISFVLEDTTIEIALGQRVHELREEVLPSVHRQGLSTGFCGKVYEISPGKVEIDTGENSS